MPEPTKKPWETGSQSAFNFAKRANFDKMLRNIIEIQSEENLAHLNHIRLWFTRSTSFTEHICQRMQALTRTLREPDEQTLQIIQDMIGYCRHLYRNSEILANDYEILRKHGLLVAELEAFRKAYRRLQEVVYHIESVYMSLHSQIGINDLLRRN